MIEAGRSLVIMAPTASGIPGLVMLSGWLCAPLPCRLSVTPVRRPGTYGA
jgi:hypothetical protein